MRKVYKKPYLEVVEYVGDYGYASNSMNTCRYLTCLVGGQSENIEGVTVYKYEYNGTMYYIWYKYYSDYSGSGSNSSYFDILEYWLENTEEGKKLNTYAQSGYVHIATDIDGTYNKS